MDVYKKTFVIFYRGKDGSNKVSSSTKIQLDKEPLAKFIQVEFINLDKRNYEKYFEKLETLPSVVYIWDDEENLIDFIKSKYPQIEIRIYNMKNSSASDGIYSRTKYTIANTILNEFKENQGEMVFWIVKGTTAKKVSVYNYDYERLSNWDKKNYFQTEKEAKEYIKICIQGELANCDNMLAYYKEKKTELQKKLKSMDSKKTRKED